MIDFKCKFCNTKIDIDNITRVDYSNRKSYLECRTCNTCNVYFIHEDNNLIEISFKVSIRYQDYWWSLYLLENKSAILNTNEHVRSFDFIPELTPQTVAVKLKKYLNFL